MDLLLEAYQSLHKLDMLIRTNHLSVENVKCVDDCFRIWLLAAEAIPNPNDALKKNIAELRWNLRPITMNDGLAELERKALER